VGRILDVGCSSGLFLELARREGWGPHGVELSERAVKAAKRNFGLNAFCGTLAQARFPDASFDAVTLWDDIEHFDDPKADLVEVARVTRPGGVLVISTPNCASLFHAIGHLMQRLTLGHARPLLQLLYPDKHNTYFSPPTLAAMLRGAGFRVVARAGFAAHPGRWLRARVSPALRAAASALDLASALLGGQYRMLLFARREPGGSRRP
jgi:2-polyprenyl-3-methyl-5-hydroxy-6-metoxy-1,4-benzoquinol methylase